MSCRAIARRPARSRAGSPRGRCPRCCRSLTSPRTILRARLCTIARARASRARPPARPAPSSGTAGRTSASTTSRTVAVMSARSSASVSNSLTDVASSSSSSGSTRSLTSLQLDLEADRLAGQLLGAYSDGHGQLDVALLPDASCRRCPRSSSSTSRPSPSSTRVLRARAALERLAVHAALEVDHQEVALAARRARPRLSSATLSRSRSISPSTASGGHLGRLAHALEPLVRLDLGRRLDLDLGGEGERRALDRLVRPVDGRPVDRVDPDLGHGPRVPAGEVVAQRLLDDSASRPTWRASRAAGRLALAESRDTHAARQVGAAHGRMRGRHRQREPQFRGGRGSRRVRRPESS